MFSHGLGSSRTPARWCRMQEVHGMQLHVSGTSWLDGRWGSGPGQGRWLAKGKPNGHSKAGQPAAHSASPCTSTSTPSASCTVQWLSQRAKPSQAGQGQSRRKRGHLGHMLTCSSCHGCPAHLRSIRSNFNCWVLHHLHHTTHLCADAEANLCRHALLVLGNAAAGRPGRSSASSRDAGMGSIRSVADVDTQARPT